MSLEIYWRKKMILLFLFRLLFKDLDTLPIIFTQLREKRTELPQVTFHYRQNNAIKNGCCLQSIDCTILSLLFFFLFVLILMFFLSCSSSTTTPLGFSVAYSVISLASSFPSFSSLSICFPCQPHTLHYESIPHT